MPGKREWPRRAPPRTYVEVFDGEEYALQEAERPYPDPWGLKEYVIRRGDEAVLAVHARGTGLYWIHSPLDPDRNHLGYVQHSRRGALLPGALLLAAGSRRRGPSWERQT